MHNLKKKSCDSRKVLLICAYCNKRKNASGYWEQGCDPDLLNPGIEISHGICPECLVKEFPHEFALMRKEGKIEFKTKTTSDNQDLYGCFLKYE